MCAFLWVHALHLCYVCTGAKGIIIRAKLIGKRLPKYSAKLFKTIVVTKQFLIKLVHK